MNRVRHSDHQRQRYVATQLLACLAAAVVLCCSGGCNREEPEDLAARRPFENQTVAVYCSVDHLRSFLDDLQPEWQLESGAAAQFVESPTAADVLVIPLTDLGEVAGQMILRKLPDEVYEPNPESPRDWPFAIRENLCQWGNVQCVVPLSVRTFVLLARTDLVPNISADSVATWEDVNALLSESGTEGEPKPPLLLVPDLLTYWIARATPYVRAPGSFAFFFDPWDGTLLVDSPGFRKGLQEALATRSTVKVGPLSEFVEGDIPFALVPTDALWAVFSVQSPVAGKVEAYPLPGSREYFDHKEGQWASAEDKVHRVTWLDGAVAVVNADSDVAEAATAFVQFVAGPDISLRGVVDPLASLGPFRLSHFRRTSAWADAGWNVQAMAALFACVQDALANRVCVEQLQVRGSRQLLQIARDLLETAWSSEAPVAEEITETIKEQWQSEIEKIGHDKVAEDYRRSVGLVGREYLIPEM